MIAPYNTSTMRFGTFCNVYNRRCKCVRIKNYCSDAVQRAVAIRGESLRMYHCIVWVQLINTTWRSKQKRTEQNTIPKEAVKWRAREECARFIKNESFLWRAKVSESLLPIISKSSCDEAVRGIPSVVCYKSLIMWSRWRSSQVEGKHILWYNLAAELKQIQSKLEIE